MRRAILIAALSAMVAAGCSRDGAPDLISFAPGDDGPDEFAVLPTKPLEQPETYASLPAPTPEATNLVDPTPESDAIAALGGQPGVLNRPSTDGGLIAYAGRYGIQPGIRQALATQDRDFRQRPRGYLLDRWLRKTTYFKIYRREALDQERELERFRAAGIRTPAAPPAEVE